MTDIARAKTAMRYRKLGWSGMDVSVIGLGAISFGDRDRVADPEASARIVRECLDRGINFFDTANAYGDGASEEHLGNALAGRRNEAVIATKFKLSDHATGDHREGETVRERIMKSIDGSLRRLRTDHVDLYQVHHPEPDVPHEEILGPLAELVSAGKVRFIGECNYSAWRHAQSDAVSEKKAWPKMVSAQGFYNLLRRHVELEVLPFCTANDIAYIPYRPLAAGFLTGKYRTGVSAPKSRKKIAKLQQDERAQRALDGLAAFASERGRTVAELAFAWLLAHPAVRTVIAGATDVTQVAANAAAADWELTLEERDAIDAIAAWDGTDEEVEEPGRHTILRARR
jgi:aryl-alcohol dehydrogenase-like predicted oxidoreductase